jgi:nitrite reductase/ring-hydroxylating ferredoxin subunit
MKLKVPEKYIPESGKSTIYIHAKHEYLILNLHNKIYAIDNLCPHQNASLGLGEIIEDEVICPLHQYRFNIKTGVCNIENFCVERYDVEILKS